MNRPIVWIVKEQSQRSSIGSNAMDYSPAESYGDVRFITSTDIPTHSHSPLKSKWTIDVEMFAVSYDPTKDFIVATGQPTAIFHVGHVLGTLHKQPRYLIWRREDNAYRVLEMSNS